MRRVRYRRWTQPSLPLRPSTADPAQGPQTAFWGITPVTSPPIAPDPQNPVTSFCGQVFHDSKAFTPRPHPVPPTPSATVKVGALRSVSFRAFPAFQTSSASPIKTMATLQQIEANRLNAQKSTGPRSAEGKAAVRFNALKSGIDAQSQVIPGEDTAALALLPAEYYDRSQPATPEVRALVDTLVTAEWLQRRFRTLEAQLFKFGIHGLGREVEGLQVVQAYDREYANFDRLQRRINAVDGTFHRAFVALHKIESRAPQPAPPVPH